MVLRWTRRAGIGVLILGIIAGATLAAAEEVLQVQPSSDGKLEVSVTQAKVRRGVLTVRLKLVNTSDDSVEPQYRYMDAYYTDLNENKKYFVLKDEAGAFIAGPKHEHWDGGMFKNRMYGGDSRLIWMKFPAPPDATSSVDIIFPGIAPFEDIPIAR